MEIFRPDPVILRTTWRLESDETFYTGVLNENDIRLEPEEIVTRYNLTADVVRRLREGVLENYPNRRDWPTAFFVLPAAFVRSLMEDK